MIIPKEIILSNIITVILPSGASIKLPVYRSVFLNWSGKLPNFDFGKKPIIDYNGEGLFAEIAILRLFSDSGWNGVWVETYGGAHFLKDMPTDWKLSSHNVSIPSDKETLLKNIWKAGKTTSCFDIFLWKDNEILFCESKNRGKDKLTKAQTKFIEGALSCGVSTESLIIVEWDYK